MSKIAYSVNEAAALLSISRGGMYLLLSAGKIKSFKARGRRLVARTELEAFVARCTAEDNAHLQGPFPSLASSPAVAAQKSAASLKGHAMRRAAR